MKRELKMKDNSGKEVQRKRGVDFSWGFGKPPLDNGHPGQMGHEIHPISVTIMTPVKKDGKAQFDDFFLTLAAASAKAAYCSGELIEAFPADPGNTITKLAWDAGHITRYSRSATNEGIREDFELSVTELKVNNCTLRRTDSPEDDGEDSGEN